MSLCKLSLQIHHWSCSSCRPERANNTTDKKRPTSAPELLLHARKCLEKVRSTFVPVCVTPCVMVKQCSDVASGPAVTLGLVQVSVVITQIWTEPWVHSIYTERPMALALVMNGCPGPETPTLAPGESREGLPGWSDQSWLRVVCLCSPQTAA